jgi:hypothetical protein
MADHPAAARRRPGLARGRINGDRTIFAPAPAAPWPVASAASASRQAITDLLRTGESRIEADQIFAAFPRYVAAGGGLLPLPAWHEGALRDLCFGELFPRRQDPGHAAPADRGPAPPRK